MMTKIINLFGGPGAGKSSGAAYIFSKLKLMGVDCEYVSEFAKECTWQNRQDALNDQFYIAAMQAHRIQVMKNKVEVIITDSPIIICNAYTQDLPYYKEIHDITFKIRSEFDNYDYYIERVKSYLAKGRNQTEEQAKEKGNIIKNLLENNNVKYLTFPGNEEGYEDIMTDFFNR